MIKNDLSKDHYYTLKVPWTSYPIFVSYHWNLIIKSTNILLFHLAFNFFIFLDVDHKRQSLVILFLKLIKKSNIEAKSLDKTEINYILQTFFYFRDQLHFSNLAFMIKIQFSIIILVLILVSILVLKQIKI